MMKQHIFTGAVVPVFTMSDSEKAMHASRFSLFLMFAVLSCSNSIMAQHYDDSLHELGKYLLDDNIYDRAKATIILRNRQDDGEDISPLIPVFKQLVLRSVSTQKMAGVESSAAEFALLNLMKDGDERAIEHFLLSQDYYFQTQSSPTADLSSYLQFYECVDESHYEVARILCERQYRKLKTDYLPHEAGYSIDVTLYLLERFNADRAELFKEVEYWRKKLDHKNWDHFTPLIVRLANNRDLLPGIVDEIRSMPEERLLKERGHLETVAALAPFRKEAASLLASFYASYAFRGGWETWMEIYVDSAQRLSVPQRQKAYDQLKRMAQKSYEVFRKSIDGCYVETFWHSSPYGKPQFFDSNDDLKHEIMRVFGEELLIDKEGFKRSLKLDNGFGSSF